MQRKPRFGFNTHGNVIALPQNQSGRNVTIIAAMARNNGIGIANRMPWHVPEDMAQFKRLTMGEPVIMGRKTFESLPLNSRTGERVLTGRQMLVVTRDPHFKASEVMAVRSLEDALTACGDRQIFIIGGGQIYKEAMDKDLVDDMILTRFNKVASCDTFFPEPCPSRYTPVVFSSHQSGKLAFKYEYWCHIKPEKE